MLISEFVTKAHDNARKKGFWNDAFDVDPRDAHLLNPLRFALWHSEVSEAWEVRHTYQGDYVPGDLPEELADIAIRIADWCGWHKIDLAEIMGISDRTIESAEVEFLGEKLYEQDDSPASGLETIDKALAYLHWMVSACLEADRKLTFDEVKMLVGDTFACLLDIAARLGINLEVAILKKMEVNKTRPHLHGARY